MPALAVDVMVLPLVHSSLPESGSSAYSTAFAPLSPPASANTTPLTMMGVRGDGMGREVHARSTVNMPPVSATLNAPIAPGFRESVRYGEQNLYTRAKELVGDRDPRAHEFSVQLRARDADTSGQGLGLGVLVALCGALIERSIKGGLIIVGSLNLGGSVEMIPNPVAVAELAVEKGAATLLMPISARRQLFELPDELATKVSIEFYADPKDAFLKGLVE